MLKSGETTLMYFRPATLDTMKVLCICLVNEYTSQFFKCGHTNRHHKICNGWYLGLVVLASSIVRLLIPYTYLERADRVFDNQVIGFVAAYLKRLQILEQCYM